LTFILFWFDSNLLNSYDMLTECNTTQMQSVTENKQ